MNVITKIFWLSIFGIAMAFVESAVVVYLRALYYPGGFRLPLRLIMDSTIIAEPFREVATLFMLLSVAFLAGKNFRERFAYFLIAFGIWDIFYYVWLYALIGWPTSLFDWDILFLIPLPWIGPVIAPVSIALLMLLVGTMIVQPIGKRDKFTPSLTAYILVFSGVLIILYSFMRDTGATLHQHIPQPYRYDLLFIGESLFVIALIQAYLKAGKGI